MATRGGSVRSDGNSHSVLPGTQHNLWLYGDGDNRRRADGGSLPDSPTASLLEKADAGVASLVEARVTFETAPIRQKSYRKALTVGHGSGVRASEGRNAGRASGRR